MTLLLAWSTMASISPASMACCSGPPLASRGSTSFHSRCSASASNTLLVAEVADDVRGRHRRQLGEARRDEHAFGHRAPRMLEDVDHFQLVAVLQVLLADRLEIGDGLHRIRRAARDVQTQDNHSRRDGRRVPWACAAARSSCRPVAAFPRERSAGPRCAFCAARSRVRSRRRGASRFHRSTGRAQRAASADPSAGP